MNKVLRSIYRSIYIHSNLCKNNARYKLKVEPKTSIKFDAMDIRAKRTRDAWEEKLALENAVVGKFCDDDVYFEEKFEKYKYSACDAISNFQDACLDPMIFDSPKSVIKAKVLLNMKSKKQNKFVNQFDVLLKLPNKLDFIPDKKVVVFCKSKEQIQLAVDNGAWLAGDEDLVSQFLKGQYNYEEFDRVICDESVLTSLRKIKQILRNKLPENNTAISQIFNNDEDIKQYILINKSGLDVHGKRVNGIPEESHVDFPVGLISWSLESLTANLNSALCSIMEFRSPQIQGDFITRVELVCPPSDEVFRIDISDVIANSKPVDKEYNVKGGRKKSNKSDDVVNDK